MDIVKVHYDEELQGVYGDDCRYLFDVSERKLGEEVAKRINMHDEIVDVLKTINAAYEMEFDDAIDEILSVRPKIESLLERCK